MTPRSPESEIVVVGDELLCGRTLDTNSRYLSRALTGLGLGVGRVATVGDSESDIAQAVEQAMGRAGLVFVVGGLGPTPDDRTPATVSGLLGRRLVENRAVRRRIEERFRRQGRRLPRLALRQALVPEGARTFANPVGMVPGMAIEVRRQKSEGRSQKAAVSRVPSAESGLVILLPGVPQELEAIFETGVRPFLAAHHAARPSPSARIRTFGIPEAVIAGRLRLPGTVGIGYYPSTTGVDIVLSGPSRTQLDRSVRRAARVLGDSVYEIGDREIEEVVGGLLAGRGWRVATAESCTGGLVGDRITDVPGSSGYYAGGVVAYCNDAKVRLLGVESGTLRRFGAVSAATVKQMAAGVRTRLDADVGIAVSGIAGPGGATPKKPVGLVFTAVVAPGDIIKVEKHRFFGSRRMVKEGAATAALDLCRRMLERARGQKAEAKSQEPKAKGQSGAQENR